MNNKLKAIILDAIKQEDEYKTGWTNTEAFNYAWDRFTKEKGWEIARKGIAAAAIDWFQGLALHVPFWDDDIEERGFDPETYWQQLATTFLLMNQSKFYLP
tara:strand:+ start:235 stop:537 length:303 start_codon:yes stop_codon:yes gene_type:complete